MSERSHSSPYCEVVMCTKRALEHTDYCQEHTLDFDEAHEAWMRNKTKLRGKLYQYVCGALKRDGNYCKKSPMPNSVRCRGHCSK